MAGFSCLTRRAFPKRETEFTVLYSLRLYPCSRSPESSACLRMQTPFKGVMLPHATFLLFISEILRCGSSPVLLSVLGYVDAGRESNGV